MPGTHAIGAAQSMDITVFTQSTSVLSMQSSVSLRYTGLPNVSHFAMSNTTETSATVSSKGQVVIPSGVRKHLGLVQGSVVRFVVSEDSVRLVCASGSVQRLKGRLPKLSQAVSLAEMDSAIAQRKAAIGRA